MCAVVREIVEWVGERVGCVESLCLLLGMTATKPLDSSECYDVELSSWYPYVAPWGMLPGVVNLKMKPILGGIHLHVIP